MTALLEATAAACPVCHARPGQTCRAVDRLPLPSVHGERTASTPLFDQLLAEQS